MSPSITALRMDPAVSDSIPRVYVLVTWDEIRGDDGRVTDSLPIIRHYEDGGDASDSYAIARLHHDAAYLYVCDESGHMDPILETERLPRG